MPHSLILGITESGKTTLAKELASAYRRQGVSVLALDPMHDLWDADYQTADNDEFLRVVWGSKSCAIFVDEAGDAIGQYDKTMNQLATKGRHWGHNVHFITQRGAMISRTIRDQCSRLFLFATARPDAKIHAVEWNSPELEHASKLEKGAYFDVTRFGQAAHRRIF